MLFLPPVTRVCFDAILADTRQAFLVRIGENEFWIPRHLAEMRDYMKCLMDVESWFVRQCLHESAARSRQEATAVRADMVVDIRKTMVSQANSRPHQLQAFEKLKASKVFALLMKCRTGKTKVGVDIACNHIMNGTARQVLWLCPVSVIPTARWQWSRFCQTPLLEEPETLCFFGLETLSACKAEKFHALLSWVRRSPTVLVIDESHMIKNTHAKRSRRAETLAAVCLVRGIMSGSPITRSIQDLFQQFKTLDWKILGYRNIHQFQRKHIEWSTKYPGVVARTKNTDIITERVQPYAYEYFPPDNPGDDHDLIRLSMSQAQRAWYEQVKQCVLNRIDRYEDDSRDIYLLFTALQSVLSGEISPSVLRHLDLEDSNQPVMLETPKIEALACARAEIDGRVIVWCTRRHEISAITAALPDVYCVTGSVAPVERHLIIQTFRKSPCGTLVAMIQVARRGIDIFEADTAIFYGQSFDYESREQAAARIQAPGIKDTACHYTDMIYRDSLDERILASHARKESIIKSFIGLMRENKEKAMREIMKL